MNKWRPVQLPRKLVDKIEVIVNEPESNYRNISDFLTTIIREKLERINRREIKSVRPDVSRYAATGEKRRLRRNGNPRTASPKPEAADA